MSGRERWQRLFLAPAPAAALVATRAIVALHSLWIVLSRPELPELAGWPAPFFRDLDPGLLLRFGIGTLPLAGEQVLYLLLHATLALAALGLRPRLACGVSAALLYHFAPFEEAIMGMPHTFFGGLTLPVLGLTVLALADAPKHGVLSPEHRWPVVLIRLLFSFNYFFAGVAKLRFGGLLWFTGDNLANWAIENWALSGAPWALRFADSSVACWTAALGTGLLEFLFPLAAFSPRAAAVLAPLALAGHFAIAHTLGIFFPSFPLLLLYVDWDALARGRPAQSGDGI